jgi:hypothetical protein
VTDTLPRSAIADRFVALLRGEPIPWRAFDLSTDAFLRACHDYDVTGLVGDCVRALPESDDWPREVRDALAADIWKRTAHELVQAAELTAVLEALAAAAIQPIIVKGTALAHGVYPSPASRPRVDTDLLIHRDQIDGMRRVMGALGYTAPLHCEGELLFCQFPLQKIGRFGAIHRFDCHWKISTQAVFADVLTFDEVSPRTRPLPALGAHARTLAPADALLLACIHPVMHHRNADTIIWIHDIHLLASSLADDDFERFTAMAIAKEVSAICGRQLRVAQATFGTRVPASTIDRLAVERAEASAVYLQHDRRWIDELASSLRGLPRWRDRLRLLREIAFPAPAYMRASYDVAASPAGATMLPALYVHRLVAGALKIVSGRK